MNTAIRVSRQIGLSPLEVLDLTPHHLMLLVQGESRAREDRRAEAVTHLWLHAAWSKQKKMPALSKVLQSLKPRAPEEVERALDRRLDRAEVAAGHANVRERMMKRIKTLADRRRAATGAPPNG